MVAAFAHLFFACVHSDSRAHRSIRWAPSEPQSDSTPRHSKYRYGYLHPYSNIHHGPFDPVPGSRQPWTLSAWHSVPERPPEVRFPGPSRVAGSRRGRGTSIAWVGDQSMKRAESLGMLYPSHVVGYAVTDSYPSKRPPPPLYSGPGQADPSDEDVPSEITAGDVDQQDQQLETRKIPTDSHVQPRPLESVREEPAAPPLPTESNGEPVARQTPEVVKDSKETDVEVGKVSKDESLEAKGNATGTVATGLPPLPSTSTNVEAKQKSKRKTTSPPRRRRRRRRRRG